MPSPPLTASCLAETIVMIVCNAAPRVGPVRTDVHADIALCAQSTASEGNGCKASRPRWTDCPCPQTASVLHPLSASLRPPARVRSPGCSQRHAGRPERVDLADRSVHSHGECNACSGHLRHCYIKFSMLAKRLLTAPPAPVWVVTLAARPESARQAPLNRYSHSARCRDTWRSSV